MSEPKAGTEISPKAFDTKDAIDLLIKQTTVVNTLWGVYAAVCFTAGGFGLNLRSSSPHDFSNIVMSLFAALGFGIFLYGHWCMIRGSVVVIVSVTEELKAQRSFEKDAMGSFNKTIDSLIEGSPNVKNTRWAHLIIDFCSMAVLLTAPWIPAAVAASTGK
jgi:hypothetical protein